MVLTAVFLWCFRRSLRGIFAGTMDSIVDSARWLRTQMWRRQLSANATKHRMGGGSGTSMGVWQILNGIPESEYVAARPGKHADKRGWRYPPKVWYLIERLRDERSFNARVGSVISELMADIDWMLRNPPEPERVHGCASCRCQTIEMQEVALV